jgi:hypothetical protein
MSGMQGMESESGGCAAFGPLLDAFYHRALEQYQARAVAEHAAGCDRCQAALERFAETDRLIASAPIPAPGPALRERLAARIALERAHRTAGTLTFSHPITRETVVRDMNEMNDTERADVGRRAHRSGRGMQRMRVWLGTIAAILVVALLAGALLTRMHSTPGQTNNQHGSGPATSGACAPGTISAQLPANTWLSELAMVSPGEGWAVGSVSPAGGGTGGATSATPSLENPESANALILRFHNCTWTPVATNYPGTRLSSISMDSPSDGWAVGGVLGMPLALHYKNGVWASVALPGQNALQGGYAAVRMRSSDEGWIVVEYTKDQRGNTSSTLLHLVNGQWSAVNVPLEYVEDVLPVGQDEAWVAGNVSDSPLTPALYHYHAGEWTSAALPSGIFIDRLRMDSPTDIWASAHAIVPLNSEGSQAAAVVFHYDGATWAQVNLGNGEKAQLVQAFDASAAWAFSLQRTNAGETISSMQYGGGNTWQTVKLPTDDLLDVSSLARVAPDEYWAIGHYVVRATGKVAPVLLYFANGAWHAYGR